MTTHALANGEQRTRNAAPPPVPGGAYRIVRFDNGRAMQSRLPFDYIDPDFPTLARLREQEGLDELAATATGEFDLICKVRQYVKDQWDHSFHGPMQHVNALEVLEDVRSGLRGNFCVYFTHVLLQALWSVGVPCRYMHVGMHHWLNHSSSECWSDEHRKWIVFDGDFNLHLVRPELVRPGLGPVRRFVPQSAREIQQAFRSGQMGDILSVQGTWSAAIDYSKRLGEHFGGCIGYLADYQHVLEQGPPEWAGQSCRWFVWSEPAEPLKDYHFHHFKLTHGNGQCQQVSAPEDYYWPVNETVITPPAAPLEATANGGSMELRFETFTPFFAGFEVQADDGVWRALAAERTEGHRAWGRYRWALTGGRHVLRVRSRNKAGRCGAAAMLEMAAPPCIAPEPAGCWDVRGAGMGGLAAQEGRLYLPRKLGAVAVVVNGEVTREVGNPIPYDSDPHDPPLEPLNESANIRRAAAAPLGHLLAPQACAVALDGTLYVGDAENYRIQVFGPDGRVRGAWGSQGSDEGRFLHIRALAVGRTGAIYVADSGYAGPVGARTEHVSRIQMFSAEGRLLACIASEGAAPGQISTPAGLCIDGADNLWVADSANHRVQWFTPAGKAAGCWGRRGDGWGELRFPTDVAVAPDSSVFVADPQHRCVWKFSATGQALTRWDEDQTGAILLRPGRLAIDGDRLYVGDVGTGLVHVYRLE